MNNLTQIREEEISKAWETIRPPRFPIFPGQKSNPDKTPEEKAFEDFRYRYIIARRWHLNSELTEEPNEENLEKI
jgi:hypothetical protein